MQNAPKQAPKGARQPREARDPKDRAPISATAAVIRASQVHEYLGVSAGTCETIRRAPDFPAVVVLSERARGYRRSDLDAFIARRQVRRSAA